MDRIEKMEIRASLARGEKEVELVLKNCKIINVFTHEIHENDIAINNGKIIGFGDYKAKKYIDVKGKYVSPGLVDSHMHLESTLVTPQRLAEIVVPNGTTTIIADPHEIANVLGVKGINYLIDSSKDIPLNIFFMIPSCVPATSFEDTGARVDYKDTQELLKKDLVLGLGELMDYPSVINGDKEILKKMELAKRKIVDGHAPGLMNKELNAYMINGVKTDHECATIEEMKERLNRGMYVSIREGSASKDLKNLIGGVNEYNYRRCLFCSDDKNPEDLINKGHINYNVKLAIKSGIDPITAIQMATINASECYRLRDIGGIAPGYDADLLILNDLNTFDIHSVYKKGKLVYNDNKILFKTRDLVDESVRNTVNIADIDIKELVLKLDSDIAYVIGVKPFSLITEKALRKVSINEKGEYINNEYLDICKMAVIERHHATGKIGLGLVENFNLTNGAIATTISHDSHNLVVLGDNDRDMLVAINRIKEINGGIVIVRGNEVKAELKLDIAGLITDIPLKNVEEKLSKMLEYSFDELKINKNINPFMTLSFMSLPVIPSLKLTARGLFDVDKFEFINVSKK
ncbi:MAG: adenine deaminase [Bacillota bacterium]|nr:adenine deaminase [Bacillota bacterium]